MLKLTGQLLTAAALLLAFHNASAEPSTDTRLSAAGRYRVTASPSLTPLVINRIHTWVLHVEHAAGNPVEAAEISISGGMPLHDHGLPTAPRATRYLGDGDYLVEGMKFHMRGEWVLEVEISADGRSDTVTFEMRL